MLTKPGKIAKTDIIPFYFFNCFSTSPSKDLNDSLRHYINIIEIIGFLM